MKMKENDMIVFYVKNVKTGRPAMVETFHSYEEAEKYWEDITPLCLPVWDVHFHFDFGDNKERDDLKITKEVIFGKAKVELR